MSGSISRRDSLKRGFAAASLTALVPNWILPALAQGETQIPFTDLPATLNFTPAADRRTLDVRKIDGPFTPADQFFTTQHYGHPTVDPIAFQLRVSGLVDRPRAYTLDELKKLKSTEIVAGFECSGNRRPLQGLSGNGRWTGVPLRTLLTHAGLKRDAHEIVFFGADKGDEDVDFRGTISKVQQQFGRSLTREKAMSPELLVAYALNGEPLTKHQGFPLRLIVPGWYGVANVKWLSSVHAQEDPYLGRFQARWYRTLRGETIDGETKWTETGVTHMQLKSFIARVSREGNRFQALGVVLNDGTPIKSIEVKVDDGQWKPAAMEKATNGKYSWKLFRYTWEGSAPGEHTVTSRVTDVTGKVQPTLEDLANKKTFLEDNSQHPRKIMVS